MDVWQTIGFALAAALLCVMVRRWQPELGALVAVGAGAILLLGVLEQLQGVKSVMERLATLSGLGNGYLSLLLKVLAIGYVAELAAQTCADLGEGGLAMKVSLCGKLVIFSLAAPLMYSFLELIVGLLP